MEKKDLLFDVLKEPFRHARISAGSKPILAVLPGYFPDELIASGGAHPVHVWGGRVDTVRADAALQSYICSMAKAVLEDVLDGTLDFAAGFVVPSVCDTMQNMSDLISSTGRKVFCFRAPRTSFDEEAGKWLALEVARFNSWIKGVTGKSPDESSLKVEAGKSQARQDAMKKMYSVRAENPGLLPPDLFYGILRASWVVTPDETTALIKDVLEGATGTGRNIGKRVVVSGTAPIPSGFLKEFDEAGLAISDDDLMAGRRTVMKPVLKSFSTGDIFESFLGGDPCPSIVHGHDNRPAHIAGLVEKSKAVGVVFWQTKACENEAFDLPWVVGELRTRGIKTVVVETEQKMRTFETAASRLSAFAEGL